MKTIPINDIQRTENHADWKGSAMGNYKFVIDTVAH